MDSPTKMGAPLRAGMNAICDNVKLVEYFDGPEEDLPSFLVAECSVDGCINLARGFREGKVSVCFDHGASRPPLSVRVTEPSGGAAPREVKRPRS